MSLKTQMVSCIFGLLMPAYAQKTMKNANVKPVVEVAAKDTVEIAGKKAGKEAEILLKKEMDTILKGLNIDSATIKRLRGLEPTAFISESGNEIWKAMHLSPELMPRIILVDNLEKGVGGLYELATHSIQIPRSALKKSRITLFSNIAHEMQHAKQGLHIFRSKIGPKAIEAQAKNAGQFLSDSYVKMAQASSADQLAVNESLKDILLKIINAKEAKDPVKTFACKKILEEELAKTQKEGLLKLREKILAVLGSLPSEAEEIVAKRYYDGFNKSVIERMRGNLLGYAFASTEKEAYVRGSEGFFEFLFKSFFR